MYLGMQRSANFPTNLSVNINLVLHAELLMDNEDWESRLGIHFDYRDQPHVHRYARSIHIDSPTAVDKQTALRNR